MAPSFSSWRRSSMALVRLPLWHRAICLLYTSLGHVLVLGDPVVQHGVGVYDQLVAALLKGDAVHLLVLDGSGLVGRVDGDHIVVALFLAGQARPVSYTHLDVYKRQGPS